MFNKKSRKMFKKSVLFKDSLLLNAKEQTFVKY